LHAQKAFSWRQVPRRTSAIALTALLAGFGLVGGTNTAPAAADGSEFADTAGSVFEPDIRWLAEEAITQGCNPPANDRFCPGLSVTRGQMAAFLSRALDLNAGAGEEFADVAADHPFGEDIDAVAAAGITRGYGDDTFRPAEPVNRGQMAAFMYRALADDADDREDGRSDDRDTDEGGDASDGATPTGGPSAGSLDSSNTGPRAAGISPSELTSVSGGLSTSEDGQVIEGVDVDGGIRVAHRDVTIRDSRVRHSGGYGISVESGVDVGTVTIENVEVDGQGVADGIGIYVTAPVQVSRANIHGQRVGMQVSSDATVESSYIHSQAVASGTHNTAMSSHGATGLVIRGNRLESSTSASLSLYPRLAPIQDAQVTENLFEGTGQGIGLYAGFTSNHPYHDQNRDIVIEGNRWTGSFQHGTHLAWNPDQPGNRWGDNAWDDGSRIDG
jgi:hypothetical protein